MSAVDDIAELQRFYSDPPAGVRANMIFSTDGAAAGKARLYRTFTSVLTLPPKVSYS